MFRLSFGIIVYRTEIPYPEYGSVKNICRRLRLRLMAPSSGNSMKSDSTMMKMTDFTTKTTRTTSSFQQRDSGAHWEAMSKSIVEK
jgi:hypothetical protein